MVIRHCAYWASLSGEPATTNTDTVTVRLPRIQQFTPDALQQLMQRVNDGGTP